MPFNPVILFVLLAALALSFLLSGMEAGVFVLSRVRVRRQMQAGRHSAKLLHGYLQNPENFLWTIVVGNTGANFFILGWTIYVLHEFFRDQRILFVAVLSLIVFLFYTFFDLLPKMLFRAYPNRLCLALAGPFRFIHLLLRPLVGIVEGVSAWVLRWTGGKAFKGHLFGNREELRFLMQESGQSLTSEERAMINRVLDLASLSVRQVMRPLAIAATAESDWPVTEVFEKCRQHHFTRLPVWEQRDGHRRVAGLLSLNSLLFQSGLDPERPVREFIRPALFVDEDLRLEEAFRRMQRAGQRMAIVLSRDRREIGLVTLGDILKAIFGDVNL
jgi:CBS domain containing-hemolysin-like protein